MKLKFAVSDEGKTINSMIENWTKRSAQLVADLHVILASCVVHVVKHGNVTPARNIVAAMGTKETAWRSNAVLAWFEAYGPFVYVKEAKRLDYDASRIDAFKAEYAKDADAFVKRLMTETFEKFKPQSEYAGFNLKTELKRIITKAHSAAEKHADSGKVDITGIEAVEATFKTLFANA